MAVNLFQTPGFDPRGGGPQGRFRGGPTFPPPNPALSQQPGIAQQAALPQQLGGPAQQSQPQLRPQQLQQAVPQTGLIGAEQALQGGFQGALGAQQQGTNQALNTLLFGNELAQGQLQQGQQALGGNFNVDPNTGQPLFQRAEQGVGQFVGAGANAQQRQAALTGALGAEAQQAAQQGFIESPGQVFARDQALQDIINQNAATGGLGGGEVLKELQQRSLGLTAQNQQQNIQNLAQLSGQGLQAAGQQGQFLTQAGQQQGNLANQNVGRQLQAAQSQANLFGQGAGISAGLAGQGAGFQQQGGLNAANLFQTTGQNVAQGRTQAGRDIAGQVGASSSALANLQSQQGTGLSDILGQGSANVGNLLSGFGQLSAQQQQDLMTQLVNLSTGQATQLAGGAGDIGQAQAGGITGSAQALGGTLTDVAGLAALFSDVRLKDNITKIGEKNGVNIYRWTWNGLLGLTGKAIGVLAQEVEKFIPNSVVETDTGYKAVRYDIVGDYINGSI